MVSDLFSGTCYNRILKLQRIQNPALYALYAIQRKKMDEANGLGSNEMLLFHGTAMGNCNAINHKGFNRSYGWQKSKLLIYCNLQVLDGVEYHRLHNNIHTASKQIVDFLIEKVFLSNSHMKNSNHI